MAGDTIKFLIEMRDGASGPLKKVGKAADQSGKDAKTATTKYTELSSKLHLMGMAAKAARGAVLAIVKPMKMLAVGGISAGAEMEGFETRLKVLMGSSAAAKKRLDELFKIGSTTPFQLPGLIEAEVNLRALGVNAEETLPLVMDFAGAMKVDVARAAVEVGRAMQFGAGAVETIAGRSLRAQVELKTGSDALKMSTEEFRDAMVATLTDKDGIFKGGTDELAKTFDGMVSNLQDAWFKFKKETGESDLFLTAKATLKTILDMLDENKKAVSSLAATFGKGLAESILFVIDLMFKISATFVQMQIGGETFKQIWIAIKIGINEASRTLNEFLNKIPGLDFSEDIAKTTKMIGEQNLELAATADVVDALKEKQMSIVLEGADTIEKIERLRKEFAAAPSDKGRRQAPPPKQQQQQAASAEAEADKQPTAEELEDAMRASLEGTEASLREALVSLRDLQYKLSPAGLAEGLVNKLTDSFGALTTMMGPAGGLVQSLSIMGQEGAGKITKALKDSINGLIVGLVEVLPKLIVSIPRAIINAVPDLIEGIFLAIPALSEAILIGLPVAIARGLARWFRNAIATIEAIFFPNKAKREERKDRRRKAADELMAGDIGFKEAFERFFNKGKKHAGTAHVDRTGAFLLQAGEAVVPNSGTTTQGMDRRMGGRGGMNVTINTNVVDKNAIRGLGKLLEQEFHNFGRSTSPLFNSPTG